MVHFIYTLAIYTYLNNSNLIYKLQTQQHRSWSWCYTKHAQKLSEIRQQNCSKNLGAAESGLFGPGLDFVNLN
jgi:hypothetical protein